MYRDGKFADVTGQGASIKAPTTFYNDVFTVMIFTDVLILILSLVVSGQYENGFSQRGLRGVDHPDPLSLTEGYPYGAPLAIVAMLFGILTLLVYNYHQRISGSQGG